MLTDGQVEQIQQDVDRSAISMPALKEDLVDHFCCVVEEQMRRGIPFEEAYAKAFRQICPNGLDEIQQETIFLLNAQKILLMKKMMYLIGLLSSMALSLGFIFRILNWPGGVELIIGGTFGFAFLFLPMLALNHYKSDLHRVLSERVKLVLGYTSAILFATSVLFKILHLQFADILLLLSGVVFAFGFLPFLFFRMYRRSVG
jgi:hypothetical protein